MKKDPCHTFMPKQQIPLPRLPHCFPPAPIFPEPRFPCPPLGSPTASIHAPPRHFPMLPNAPDPLSPTAPVILSRRPSAQGQAEGRSYLCWLEQDLSDVFPPETTSDGSGFGRLATGGTVPAPRQAEGRLPDEPISCVSPTDRKTYCSAPYSRTGFPGDRRKQRHWQSRFLRPA